MLNSPPDLRQRHLEPTYLLSTREKLRVPWRRNDGNNVYITQNVLALFSRIEVSFCTLFNFIILTCES